MYGEGTKHATLDYTQIEKFFRAFRKADFTRAEIEYMDANYKAVWKGEYKPGEDWLRGLQEVEWSCIRCINIHLGMPEGYLSIRFYHGSGATTIAEIGCNRFRMSGTMPLVFLPRNAKDIYRIIPWVIHISTTVREREAKRTPV